ncbi:Diaminopimelate decarboxylase protein [Halorhabdus tiamatea SARL4B]|uniref:Diaminopimelate decarboxylase n=1 Tax=Halorhabdus tiamatea SARL4B TaxID=1033806 RepID=F7PM17_9EURY|nr:diaminopimelate decarboxylase [Halorhabdus tiamatea]ERJ06374.1 Diaminopimelate decarboxylase protein [Halorhabdus tiamatea SARL4B]CCQ34542.1 diaminopimelate decarboxylase [Halorhabdus tiamatea SARL4B]
MSHSPPVRRLADWDHTQLLDLAAEHDTPLYVLDPDRVAENYRRFSAAFPDADVMYAAKAHTGRAVLSTLLEAGADIECAARGELQRATEAGADPNTLQYTAVNPPDADLDYAVELAGDNPGLTITGGAEDTFDRLEARGYDGRVAIRINPGIGTGHHEKVATGKDAKFGIPAERVPDLADELRDRFDLVGLHAHVGSGVLTDEVEKHAQALGTVADLAREVGDDSLEFVDFGGGFGVPYHEDEPPLDIEAVAETVREAVGDLDATLKFEPGRYVVADAEVILTTVNTIKETQAATVVGVDASLSTLIRPAMFDSYHPIRSVSAPDRADEPVSVGGPCCTSADVFATDRPIARPERDDILAIGNAGAYGYELANNFHSQPRPAEVAIDGDDARVVRRRERMADVTRVEDEAPGAPDAERE